MPTPRETILAALHARRSALPATALRGDVLPERVPAAGLLILRDCEPGEGKDTPPPHRSGPHPLPPHPLPFSARAPKPQPRHPGLRQPGPPPPRPPLDRTLAKP